MLLQVPTASLGEFATVSAYSLWTSIPMLLMGSFVAGAVEEAAFRGYMQVPLEGRYGPATAIGVVAAAFTLAHLPPPAAWPGFFLAAVGWGALAYLSGSIVPGVVFHTAVDAAVWIWAVSNRETFEKILTSSVFEEGSTVAFASSAVLTLVLGGMAAMCFFKLAAENRAIRHANLQ